MGEFQHTHHTTMKSVFVLLLVAIVSVSLANTGFDEEVPEDSLVASSSTATSSSGFLFKAIKKALAKHRRKVCAKRANKCHKKVAKKTAKHAKKAKQANAHSKAAGHSAARAKAHAKAAGHHKAHAKKHHKAAGHHKHHAKKHIHAHHKHMAIAKKLAHIANAI